MEAASDSSSATKTFSPAKRDKSAFLAFLLASYLVYKSTYLFSVCQVISCESRLSRDGMHVRRVAVAPLFILFLHRSFPAPIPWMVVKVIGKDGRPPRKKAAKCSVWR
jgi:hypothetical protein